MTNDIQVQRMACPACGAPLPPPERDAPWACAYCGSQFTPPELPRSEAVAEPQTTFVPATIELADVELTLPKSNAWIWKLLLFLFLPPAWALMTMLDKKQSIPLRVAAGLFLSLMLIAVLAQAVVR